MKNKIILVLLAISIAINIFTLSGCDGVEASNPARYRMIEAGGDNNYFSAVKGKVIIDTQTSVEYWCVEGGDVVTLTLLVDQDGNPLIYKGE